MVVAHARLSPSASKRWLTCPGSVALCEAQGEEQRTSKYAAEGTVAHEIGERCLLEHKEPKDFLGEVMEADGFKFTVTQEMIDAVQVYADYIYDQINEAEIQADALVELNVEVHCSLKHLGITGLDGGTSDALLVCEEHQFIIVADYKHGQGVLVDPEENTQAMQYALGSLHKLGIPKEENWTVIIAIIQPRARDAAEPVREWRTDSDYLYKWQDEVLIPGALATKEPDADLVPSEDGCRFCAAAGNCPALYDKTQELAIADFAEDKFPEPKTMTPEQKITVMEHIEMIRAFLVAVEKQVTEEVEAGSKDYEDKYKLVRKTTHRKLDDIVFDEDFSPLAEYIDLEELIEPKVKALGEIKSLLKRKLEQNYSKAEAKQILEKLIEESTNKPEGGLVIAPLKDKRIAQKTSAQNDFKDYL